LIASLVAIGVPQMARAESNHPAIVAVFEIADSTGRPKALITALTAYLRVKLAESRNIKVVDKGEQEASLKRLITRERKNSYRTCVDSSCQIPLGRELAADKILRGKLTRIGHSYIVAVEMIDLASGASSNAASDKSDGTEEQLLASVERVAGNLIAAMAPPVAPVEAETAAEPEASKADLAPAPVPSPAAPSPVVRMEAPEPSGVQLTLAIGGFVLAGAAYLTEIVAQLISSDFSHAYYAVFPVIGPVLVEQINKSSVMVNGDGTVTPYKSNPLNYVDAAVQVVGGGIALLGLISINNNAPVPVTTPSSATPNAASELSVHLVATPRMIGLWGSF
jgi:hypothetical protein